MCKCFLGWSHQGIPAVPSITVNTAPPPAQAMQTTPSVSSDSVKSAPNSALSPLSMTFSDSIFGEQITDPTSPPHSRQRSLSQ